MRMLVCSQTPLIRFLRPVEGVVESVDFSELVEGADYIYSPGGVTRMVYPLLSHMLESNFLEEAHWISLNPAAPDKIRLDRLWLHFVKLGSEALKGYGAVKESMWKIFHGMQNESTLSLLELAWSEDYIYYNMYNRVCSETAMTLDKEIDFDVFYIHDFQQLPMGEMMKTMKPKIFRWHIPFDKRVIPPEWPEFLVRFLNSYDAIVVSSKNYMKTLLNIGYGGKAYYVYPYIDAGQYGAPTRGDLQRFADKHGLSMDDKIVSIVARMDPMKGHDRAIKALAKVVKKHDAKLLIVGNGSFSSSRQGLGLSKGEMWRDYITGLVKSFGLERHVVFTGHVTQKELEAAYTLSQFTVLPSVTEGFGLVVVESWLYGKPAIVSSTAGIAELVEDGYNGYVFEPDDVDGLADRMLQLLENDSLAREMGDRGRETAKLCTLERGIEAERKIIEEVVG
ncbi:MAG: glycosyltransferase [Candidatus Caldarchaeum sp.]